MKFFKSLGNNGKSLQRHFDRPRGESRSFLSALSGWVAFMGLAMLLLASAGCVGSLGKTEPGRLDSASNPSAVMAGIKERTDFWRDYQCRLRLRVDSKTSKFSTRAIVTIKGRDFVRFETFTPLGQTAALYVSNETGPSLLAPSERTIFTAGSPETLISRFLGVDLPADLFRYVLAACIPPERLDRIQSRYDAGVWRLEAKEKAGSFEWLLSSKPPALEGLLISGPQFEGRVSYDPPVSLAKEAVPGKIRISSSEWTMELAVEELKPAPRFSPSIFYQPELPDLRKVDLDKLK